MFEGGALYGGEERPTELLERLYTDASCGTDNTVEVFVHQLRKKLAPAAGAVIRTKRGHGYMIE